MIVFRNTLQTKTKDCYIWSTTANNTLHFGSQTIVMTACSQTLIDSQYTNKSSSNAVVKYDCGLCECQIDRFIIDYIKQTLDTEISRRRGLKKL